MESIATCQNGQSELSWTPPLLKAPGSVRKLWPGSEGAVYGTGYFYKVDGEPRDGFARWRAKGTLDTSFEPVKENAPTIIGLSPRDDGSVTLLRREFNRSNLQRLNSSGAIEPSFRPVRPEGVGTYDLTDIHAIEPLPGGRILATLVSRRVEVQRQVIVIFPDNTVNQRPLTDDTHVFDILTLPNGTFFLGGKRYTENGIIDASFQPPNPVVGIPLVSVDNRWLFSSRVANCSSKVLLFGDGSLDPSFISGVPLRGLLFGPACGRRIYRADPVETGDLVRFYGDGRLDPTFKGPSAWRDLGHAGPLLN